MALKLVSFENRTLMTNNIYLLASALKYNIIHCEWLLLQEKKVQVIMSLGDSVSLDDSAELLKDPQGLYRNLDIF